MKINKQKKKFFENEIKHKKKSYNLIFLHSVKCDSPFYEILYQYLVDRFYEDEWKLNDGKKNAKKLGVKVKEVNRKRFIVIKVAI